MTIKYAIDMPQYKSSKYAVVNIDDLYLDEDNPRFASSTLLSRENGIDQRVIINYLVEYGEICKLAFEINNYGGLFGEDIMSAYIRNGRIIVLEGNRRLAACKLLINNSLMYDRLVGLYPLPTKLTDETLANIQSLPILIYEDSVSAQKYIASKHTQPNIKKWTTIEQYNYYYAQFVKGNTPARIAADVGISQPQNIENKIKQYTLFKTIFELVRNQHTDLHIEAASILPVVTAFMPKLLTKGGKYSLEVKCDRETLKYTPLPSQYELYNKILFLIGEAFYVRPVAKGRLELSERPTNARYRISSDEIKGSNKVESLIDKDIRIPGLKGLILKFRDEDLNENGIKIENNEPVIQKSGENNCSGLENLKNPSVKNNAPGQSGSVVSEEWEKKSCFSQEKRFSFFADLRYEHLDRSNDDNKGLIAVAREIQSLSCANNYTGYYRFPLAASFLLRSLIEQTLSRQLKGTNTYARLCNNTAKATPELEKIVNEILRACQNGNHMSVNLEKNMSDDFVACFSGSGTKRQLDKIIHSPAECQPNKDFLDGMANGGLKSLLQKLIDSFR